MKEWLDEQAEVARAIAEDTAGSGDIAEWWRGYLCAILQAQEQLEEERKHT